MIYTQLQCTYTRCILDSFVTALDGESIAATNSNGYTYMTMGTQITHAYTMSHAMSLSHTW